MTTPTDPSVETPPPLPSPTTLQREMSPEEIRIRRALVAMLEDMHAPNQSAQPRGDNDHGA